MNADQEQSIADLHENVAAIHAAFDQFGIKMSETFDGVGEIMRQFGVTAQEAADSMADAWQHVIEHVRQHYPHALDEHGELRDDWLEIIERDKAA
jgi:phage-related minor tail protein